MLKLFRKWLNPAPYVGHWTSVETPPPKGTRVLVRNKNKEVNIAHIDPEVEDQQLWVAFTIEISGRTYKFNVIEATEWKSIPT